MGAKKTTSYICYVLIAFLVTYLLLVWMYFKDNASNLTSEGLLTWFIIIPLTLILSIIVIKFYEKKLAGKAAEQVDTRNTEEETKNPKTYQLFAYSSLCLPEGDNWSEIINNDKDLTTLSENLSDFDGLPVLIKPIARVDTEAALLSAYRMNSDTDNANMDYEHLNNGNNGLTSRLWALIHEQFILSAEVLSIIAQHFASITQKTSYQPNSAIHMHPEWQQHYIANNNEASSDKPNSENSNSPVIEPLKLTIHLCIPVAADSAFLIKSIKQQLAAYGIPEPLFNTNIIISDHSDSTESNSSRASSIANTDTDTDNELHQPIDFINKNLISLSKATSPEVCLLIAVDSQINEEWLESQLDADVSSSSVPTEAGSLLIFCNQVAQDILDIGSKVSFSLTEVDNTSNSSTAQTNANRRRDYLTNLVKIKQLLLDNAFVLSQIEDALPQAAEKRHKALTDNKTITKTPLIQNSIMALSDINPLSQPYDLSSFITFIDEIIEKGTMVNEQHLGHYMPSNIWLKHFLSLALLIDLSTSSQQELDINFLVTQHKNCNTLWLTAFSQQV